MASREIDNALLAGAFEEWQTAPNGQKTYLVTKHARAMGVSFGTMHRKFKEFGYMLGQKKTKCTRGTSKIQGLHDMAKQIAYLYSFIPRNGRKPALELAVRKAIENNMLPETAREIHIGTFARVIRELRLLDTEGRVLRFEAKKPMEQCQYDVSGSEYLYVHRFENGEPVLRVRSSKEYKNKLRYENLRLWYHGLVDDHSRYWLAMPFASPGESSTDALIFFKWAFSQKTDSRVIFRGLPNRLYLDNGPITKAKATIDFFSRIAVELKPHEPESSSDTGKIEIKWRQLWSAFESAEFLMDPHWEKREYRLSEISERLLNYTAELNSKKHPNMNITRAQAWMKIIQDGGVIDIDETAFDTTFNRFKRLIKADGTFSIDNAKYLVKGVTDAWVYVYVGLFNERVVVEDIISHKRYEATPFVMPGLDEIRSDKKLPAVSIREEAQEIKKQYVPGQFRGIYEKPQDTNVTAFPVRQKEERQIEDPFDVDTYPNMQEAMRAFCETVGAFIPPDMKEVIENKIAESKLSKEFVDNFALEVRAQMSKRERATG